MLIIHYAEDITVRTIQIPCGFTLHYTLHYTAEPEQQPCCVKALNAPIISIWEWILFDVCSDQCVIWQCVTPERHTSVKLNHWHIHWKQRQPALDRTVCEEERWRKRKSFIISFWCLLFYALRRVIEWFLSELKADWLSIVSFFKGGGDLAWFIMDMTEYQWFI